MIRLTFMTDARRVIGASTPEGNARRFALLPPALPQVMAGLYAAAAVAVGGRSLAGEYPGKRVTFKRAAEEELNVAEGNMVVLHCHQRWSPATTTGRTPASTSSASTTPGASSPSTGTSCSGFMPERSANPNGMF